MPDPIDYFNPRKPHAEAGGEAVRELRANEPVAVPAEFDVMLVRTRDLAGIVAVEAALARASVDVARGSAGGLEAELWVKARDEAAATGIAAEVFERRARLKSMPRQKVDPDPMPRRDPFGGTGFPGGW